MAFPGDTKGEGFDVDGPTACARLLAPGNPNCRLNSHVLKPWMNGINVTQHDPNVWVTNFSETMSRTDTALYGLPFTHFRKMVEPERAKNNGKFYHDFWWRQGKPRLGMRNKQHLMNSFGGVA